MKQLSGLDASFLYLETGSQFGHVSGLGVFKRPDKPGWSAYEAMRDKLTRRLPDLAPLRDSRDFRLVLIGSFLSGLGAQATLVDGESELDPRLLDGHETIGLTGGDGGDPGDAAQRMWPRPGRRLDGQIHAEHSTRAVAELGQRHRLRIIARLIELDGPDH